MYPGSGGFSPAVRNLSNGALDYWIECNLASCIEFMNPGSAGLIATPVEPNPSSAALDYCRRHFGDKDEEFARGLFMAKTTRIKKEILKATSKRCGAGRRLMTASWEEKNPKARGFFSSQGTVIRRITCNWRLVHDDQSHKEVLRIWVTNEYLPDLYLVLFEAQNNLAPPRSALQMNNPPTWTLIRQLKLDGPEDRGCIDWVSRAWQTATSVWVMGTCGRGLATCDFCLGSGGSRSWPGKLRPLFGFWGLEVVAWQATTSVWGASGSSPGKLRPLFGFWGLDVVAWQAATSVWVLGEQIEIWPGQSQLLSSQSRMLWADGNRTTWPVFLPLSWLHRGKQSAKLFA
ncbi:hypothetical protein B0H11DRAFT_2381642 [Mycena galericulata]|nr:hypothetical protein B0H11DRAFT_2381642 [Mycena galericulata]